MTLTLLIANRSSGRKEITVKALQITVWVILIYTAFTFLQTCFLLFSNSEMEYFLNRAEGAYRVAFWIMLFSATILPFTLLIRNLAHSFLYVTFIAFSMKCGYFFGRFVIITTSIHRDYVPGSFMFFDPFVSLITIFIKGIFLALLLLGILSLIEFIQKKRESSVSEKTEN